MNQEKLYLRGIIYCLIGSIILIPDALLVKLTTSISPEAIAFWRGLMMFFVLKSFGRYIPELRATKKSKAGNKSKNKINIFHKIRQISKGEMFYPSLAVTLIFSLNQMLFVFSISKTFAANVLFIFATTPAIAAIIAFVFLRERMPLIMWFVVLGICTAVGGIFLNTSGLAFQQGNFLALLVAIGVAILFTISRAFPKIDLIEAISYSGIVTAITCLVFLQPGNLIPAWEDIIPLLIMVIIIQPFGVTLIVAGSRYTSPAEAGLLILLESVFGPILVWAVLDENPGRAVILSGIIILIGIAIYNFYIMRNSKINKLS